MSNPIYVKQPDGTIVQQQAIDVSQIQQMITNLQSEEKSMMDQIATFQAYVDSWQQKITDLQPALDANRAQQASLTALL